MSRRRMILFLLVCEFLAALYPSAIAFSAYRPSEYEGLTYLQIQKPLIDPSRSAEEVADLPPTAVYTPISKNVAALLGPRVVDYDSFVATYLPEKDAETARLAAVAIGLIAWVGPDRWIDLPHFGFDPPCLGRTLWLAAV